MNASVSAREQDMRRWEGWLRTQFPRDHLARERPRPDASGGEAVWHVEFQDGKLGRIHVTGDALRLRGDAFARLVDRLDHTDWYARLDQLIRIRIDTGGTVERVD